MARAASRRARRRPSPGSRFTVGITDDVTAPLAPGRPGLLDRARRRRARRVLRARLATAPSARTSNSIKIIGEQRRPARAGLLRLRLEEVGLDDRLAPALRPASRSARPTSIAAGELRRAATSSGCSSAWTCSASRPSGATFLLNSPYGRRRSGTHLPREVQEQIIEKGLRALRRSTPTRVAARPGSGAAINTVMQTCFFALADVLPRDEAIAAIKDAIRDDVRQARRGRRRAQPRSRRPGARQRCTRSRSPTSRRAQAERHPVPGHGRRVRAARHRAR